MAKYVILLHFDVSLLQKHKKYKIQDQIRLKESSGTLALWDFKLQVNNSNFSQISGR